MACGEERLVSNFSTKINNFRWLHRSWRRMLKTKCVGDNYEMLMTVLAVFATDILYFSTLASGTNIQKL